MDFSQKLNNYVKLLVRRGANVTSGQKVHITAEAYQRELVYLLAAEAYRAGASYVLIDLVEPRLQRLRVQHGDENSLQYYPPYFGAKYRELVDEAGATIRLVGPEYPEILADLDPKLLNIARVAQYSVISYFYQEGIDRSKVHWTLAAAATPAWGRRLFPQASPQEAEQLLWDQIFRICRAEREDVLDFWDEHNRKLKKRCEKLNKLEIDTLHFVGPGTDLVVGLATQSVFKAGAEAGPRGVEFNPNIPSEECFTTPNFRRTNGHVRATRPFLINGKLVKELEMTFCDGIITDFRAREGQETFGAYINSDPGARKLGEVALVGTDSPIYQSGLVFEEILYDENAAGHIAVGNGYKFCIEGASTMSSEELDAVGCNHSTAHTDIMITSAEVDVSAKTRSGVEVSILRRGAWCDRFK